MLKPPTYTLELSNLALFGSDLEHKIKAASAAEEPAWNNAGTAPGLKIWRINKFKVESIPVSEYGTFYSGDSYIILNTFGDPANLSWDIHFWLGGTTTADEAGTAAYKTVELDNRLGEKPIQHREVQGYESSLFLSYFTGKGGIRLLDGGYDTGFRRVKPTEYRTRLLWVKGKKRVRISEVPVRWDSLNHGDAFILDAGLKIFVWQGSSSGIFEKTTAAKSANDIQDEHKGSQLFTVSDGATDSEANDFASYFPAGSGAIKSAGDGGADEESTRERILFHITDSSGAISFHEVARSAKDFSHSLLRSEDAFIVDIGLELFVWIGKNASANEKSQSMQIATDYINRTGRPPYMPVTRVFEGREPAQFKAFFK
jgi:hypothetical protein